MAGDPIRMMDKLGLNRNSFLQRDVLDLVGNPFRGAWTTVYSSHAKADGTPSIFCCLAEKEMRDEVLARVDWPVHADSFSPGFEVCGDDIRYINGSRPGYTFLVAETYFHPLEQGQLHVNNEFVLLFNLYRGDDGNYYDISESGERQLVVSIGDEVRFRTSFLMRFIAAKQLLFVQLVDSRIGSDEHYRTDVSLMVEDGHRGDSFNYKIWFQSTPQEDYLFSMLYARSVVDPGPREECRIWPYDREDDSYPEYLIMENPDGSEVRFTCDPDKLADYFGGNPEAPHYLTPVYFKPTVLDKYRNDPCFTVSERHLDCGTQWGVEIDNVIPSRVMVYLGDLGSRMPPVERRHFLAFEMSPIDQSISEEAKANDFGALWVEPSGPVARLLGARRKLDEAWCSAFGGSLFRKPHADDADMEKLIRIPSTNGREELDTVVINLDKLLVDYIDESALPRSDARGSINKLEMQLRDMGVHVDISPLRDLQSLRSTSTAHAKGKNYDKEKARLLTGNNPDDIEKLVNRLTDMMNEIADKLPTHD